MTTPDREHIVIPNSYAALFSQKGFAYGDALPDQPRCRSMILPLGWTATGDRLRKTLRDQHDRRRILVDSWPGNPDVTFLDPDSHARAVAEHGDTLVIDTWATPGSMLGLVGERIDTYHRLIYVNEQGIARWQEEQPNTAARYRIELADYRQKLTAYTGLLRRLTDTITAGWTPSWTDLTPASETAKEART